MARVHLHGEDHPVALVALAEVLRVRRRDPVGLADIGYEPSEAGVWVDWDRLEHSWLSSTERAGVTVVRGVAAAERQGGFPPWMRNALVTAVGLRPPGGDIDLAALLDREQGS
jgi:hypothetical protein